MSNNNKEKVSIIFHQKNDSPKYFEIKKSHIYVYFLALPIIVVLSAVIAGVALVQNSPFHLIDKYKQHLQTQNQINNYSDLEKMFFNTMAENKRLLKEINDPHRSIRKEESATIENNETPKPNETLTAPPKLELISSIGLSTLSMFKPIKDQRDLTRPAKIGLSGFNLTQNANSIKFHFNIIPTTISDERISGYIIVLLKDGQTISAYPSNVFDGNDFQINYSTGESFLTQRFRPVEATFNRPKNGGSYAFTVFIFSKEGDLIHYQPVTIPARP